MHGVVMAIHTKMKSKILSAAAIMPMAMVCGAAYAHDDAGLHVSGERDQETQLAQAAQPSSILTASSGEESAAADSDAEIEDRVTVVGSRIRRGATTNISPTTSIGAAEFDARGAVNVLDLLEELPALTGSESIDDNQFSFGDSGVRRANLRGLGAFRTLTVVDNRRRGSTAGSFFGRNSFDWNVLPQNLISRVDILTGGASSIYGSDAVSGVINIVLEDEMDGFEVGGGGFWLGDNGNEQYTAYATGGRTGDRWSVIGSFEYAENTEYTLKQAGREGFNSWVPNQQPNYGWPHFDRIEQPIDPNAEYDSVPRFNILDVWNQPYDNVIPSFANPAWPFFGYQAIDANGDVVLDENGVPDLPRWVFGERIPGEGEDWWIDGVGNPTVYDPALGKFRAIDLGDAGLLNFWGCSARDGCEMRDQYYDTTYWSPTRRFNAYLKGKYDLTDTIEAGAEFIYARTEGSSDIGPNLIRRNNALFASKFLDVVDLTQADAGNADLPLVTGSGLNPLFPTALHDQLDDLGETGFQVATRRLNEFGTRLSKRKQDYFAFALTFDGELPNGWEWNVSYDLGYAEYTSTTTGQAFAAEFANARDIVIDGATGEAVCRSAEARAAGCAPADLLNGISPAAVSYIAAPDAKFSFSSTMHQVMATFTGDSEPYFSLPAGPVQFASGVEWRYEENTRDLDEATQTGTGFSGNLLPSFSVDNSVIEGFVEVVAPILADVPGVKALDFEGAYRLSAYDKGGSGVLETYKYGVRWAPIEDVTFRAVKSRSIRAPHPAELGLPGSIGSIGYTDPCANFALDDNPERRDDCAAWTGFTDAELDAFTGINTGQDLSGGNPDLEPEISDTLTVGMVLQPRFLDGFWLTIDYFDIEFDQLIAQLGEQRILNECAERFSTTSVFCQAVDRDPTTQQIQLVRDTWINVNGADIEGWDLQVGYQFDVADVFGFVSGNNESARDYGEININFNGQYLERDEFIDSDGIVTDNAGDTFNPDVRLRGNFGYAYKDFRFLWNVNYFGATDTDADEPRFETEDIAYHDASVTYYFKRGDEYARLTFGVSNVFDKGTRPHTWTYGGSQFDRLGGRSYFANFSVPF